MAAENGPDVEDESREYLRETSFVHMAQISMEARTTEIAEWIAG